MDSTGKGLISFSDYSLADTMKTTDQSRLENGNDKLHTEPLFDDEMHGDGISGNDGADEAGDRGCARYKTPLGIGRDRSRNCCGCRTGTVQLSLNTSRMMMSGLKQIKKYTMNFLKSCFFPDSGPNSVCARNHRHSVPNVFFRRMSFHMLINASIRPSK